MPRENIERAIRRGTGEEPGVQYEEITYEGYGPGGVAFVVKVTTDNKQRTAQDVRSIFAKHGGNLAQNGAVAFQFLHAGQFLIPKEQIAEDALMALALEAGADCAPVLQQLAAMRGAVNGLMSEILESHVREQLHAERSVDEVYSEVQDALQMIAGCP